MRRLGCLLIAAALGLSSSMTAAQSTAPVPPTPPVPATPRTPSTPAPAMPAGAGDPARLSGQAPPAAQGLAAPRIVGTMSELMVDVIYPVSDAILYITTRTPTNEREWNELQGKALMLAEAGNLLMMPGRARDERWMEDARLMRDAGAAAFKAAKNKDVTALEDLNEAVYVSCTTCHMHYRTSYGRGRQAAPPPR